MYVDMRQQEEYYTTNFFLKFPTIRVRYYITALRNDNSLHDYNPQGSMTDRTVQLCPLHVPLQVVALVPKTQTLRYGIWGFGVSQRERMKLPEYIPVLFTTIYGQFGHLCHFYVFELFFWRKCLTVT